MRLTEFAVLFVTVKNIITPPSGEEVFHRNLNATFSKTSRASNQAKVALWVTSIRALIHFCFYPLKTGGVKREHCQEMG